MRIHTRRHPRIKKRGPGNAPDLDPLSTALRAARNLARARRFPEALAQLDAILTGQTDPARSAQIAAQAAEIELLQGRYTSAVQIYQQAKLLAGSHPIAWFTPALGEVHALLMDVQVNEARARAETAVLTAQSLENTFRQRLTQPPGAGPKHPATGMVIQARPIRASVVASRLGRLFFQEGEIVAAKALYVRATELNPGGAYRAKVGLAEVALREGDPAAALLLSKEAMVSGGFRAKTVSAWPLVIEANVRLGRPALDSAPISLLAQAPPAVRARSCVAVVTSLRNRNDPSWRDLAQSWLQAEGDTQPSVAATLHKMMLSDARSRRPAADPASIAKAAVSLLSTPKLGPEEWLLAARQAIVSRWKSGNPLSPESLLAEGLSRFGPGVTNRLLLGVAGACLKTGQSGLARTYLQRVLAGNVGDLYWRKSATILAAMLRGEGNFGAAADLYLQCAQAALTPMRVRYRLHLRWAQCLLRGGSPDAVLAAKGQLLALANQTQDYEAVLDLAYVLIDAPAEINALAIDLLKRGISLAHTALDAAVTPTAAATVLMKLARRLADFGRDADIVATWNALDESRQLWLWSANADYWEYQSLIFRAYRDGGNRAAATGHAQSILADPATPPSARAQLGVLLGLLRVQDGEISGGFALLRQAILDQPTHQYCAYAYYWLALEAYRRDAAVEVTDEVNRIDAALGRSPVLRWQKLLVLNGRCLRADLQPERIAADGSISVVTAAEQIERIRRDLTKLG